MQPEQPSPETANSNSLCKCPHCNCHFCNPTDLQKHLNTYGTQTQEHAAEFQRAHAKLEHGNYGGPE